MKVFIVDRRYLGAVRAVSMAKFGHAATGLAIDSTTVVGLARARYTSHSNYIDQQCVLSSRTPSLAFSCGSRRP